MIWVVAVFAAFFVMSLYGYRRLMRMNEDELRRQMQRGASNRLPYPWAVRVPLAVLIAGSFGLLMALALFALDYTGSVLLRVVAVALAVAWAVSVLATFCAGMSGRPSFLVHPLLRSSRSGAAAPPSESV